MWPAYNAAIGRFQKPTRKETPELATPALLAIPVLELPSVKIFPHFALEPVSGLFERRCGRAGYLRLTLCNAPRSAVGVRASPPRKDAQQMRLNPTLFGNNLPEQD
jgi:hypothetical protein